MGVHLPSKVPYEQAIPVCQGDDFRATLDAQRRELQFPARLDTLSVGTLCISRYLG